MSRVVARRVASVMTLEARTSTAGRQPGASTAVGVHGHGTVGPERARMGFGLRDGHPVAVRWSRCPVVSLPIVSETMASLHTRDTRGRGGSRQRPLDGAVD